MICSLSSFFLEFNPNFVWKLICHSEQVVVVGLGDISILFVIFEYELMCDIANDHMVILEFSVCALVTAEG